MICFRLCYETIDLEVNFKLILIKNDIKKLFLEGYFTLLSNLMSVLHALGSTLVIKIYTYRINLRLHKSAAKLLS